MTRKGRTFLFVGLSLIIGLFAGWWLQKQNLVDACLDAGGQWVANGSYCQGAGNAR